MARAASELPHNPEAERAVLGAVLLDSGVLEDIQLTSADFYLERHRVIFEACRELAADGEPVDVRTLQAKLEHAGVFDQVGGLAYLTGLDLDLPDIARAASYARIVSERALRRRLLQAANRLDQRARTGQADAAEIAAITARELEGLQDPEIQGHRSAQQQLDQVLADTCARHQQRSETGEAVIGLRSGIPRVDGLLGGLNRGLYLLAGPPGVGKTALAMQIALHVAREAPVVYATFENSAENLLLKAVAGRAGVSYRDARRGFVSPDVLAAAATELRPQLARLDILDGNGRLTVGQLRARAKRLQVAQGSRRCLLVIDYLQLWAKTSRELRDMNEVRGKVDALGGELIALAKQLDATVLALSSQSRAGGAYGRGGGEAALDSLKESGDLEYSADVALFLTEAKERHASPPAMALDLTIRKHRDGPTGVIELVFQPDRGVLREEARAS
jgi:replicative DNA helicase